MENKNEAVIANYIEKMMGERRQKIFESDEYIFSRTTVIWIIWKNATAV